MRPKYLVYPLYFNSRYSSLFNSKLSLLRSKCQQLTQPFDSFVVKWRQCHYKLKPMILYIYIHTYWEKKEGSLLKEGKQTIVSLALYRGFQWESLILGSNHKEKAILDVWYTYWMYYRYIQSSYNLIVVKSKYILWLY